MIISIKEKSKKMKIIQIVGMLTNQNVNREIQNILTNYKSDILEYEKYVQEKSLNEQIIKTGDQIIDFTTQWSQAVLTTNAHYIDGEIVPMPAQAEYNFYFTHYFLINF